MHLLPHLLLQRTYVIIAPENAGGSIFWKKTSRGINFVVLAFRILSVCLNHVCNDCTFNCKEIMSENSLCFFCSQWYFGGKWQQGRLTLQKNWEANALGSAKTYKLGLSYRSARAPTMKTVRATPVPVTGPSVPLTGESVSLTGPWFPLRGPLNCLIVGHSLGFNCIGVWGVPLRI